VVVAESVHVRCELSCFWDYQYKSLSAVLKVRGFRL
jgi:hypothetical protein